MERDHPCISSFKHLEPSTKAVSLSKDRTWASQAVFSLPELVISASRVSHAHKSLFLWVSTSYRPFKSPLKFKSYMAELHDLLWVPSQ